MTITDITEALEYMLRLIADEWEFPDAAFKAAQKFKVSQSDLEAAYDALHA